ncbi:C13 family peptidase [Neogemmobacter tilapiae]|uniref:C13 family peptidase n=1 Tax=Neogemmobacter tilapiae TaxID=875041 RepID=UPI001E31B5A2|nr:C13 family peptidase [Gemmobacter tilapiae]
MRQVLIVISLFWLIEWQTQSLYFLSADRFSIAGLQWLLAMTLMIVAGLALGCQIAGRSADLGRLIVIIFLLACLTRPLIWLSHNLFPAPPKTHVLAFAELAQQVLPVLAIFWLITGGRRQGLWRGALVALCFLMAQGASQRFLLFEPMVYRLPPPSKPPINVEALYLAQPQLLQDQLAALPAQDPAKAEVFGLLLGGSAHQSVFLSEVEQGGAILEKAYGADGHFLQLVNSDDVPLRYPLANRTNLEIALGALARHVGPEDILFLYMTSHGREDLFKLEFAEAGTTNLVARDFAAMLDRASIGPAVIVLSACHSGSFIDELAAPDRLILTAAAADRTSFGCRDGGDWTYFGRALLAEALVVQPDPRRAFASALTSIAAREAAEDLQHSLPQISEGARIGALIDAVLAQQPALRP